MNDQLGKFLKYPLNNYLTDALSAEFRSIDLGPAAWVQLGRSQYNLSDPLYNELHRALCT